MTGWETDVRPLEGLASVLGGGRLLMTGGTGFFGQWLARALLTMVDRLGLDLSLVVLARSPERVRRELPDIAGHAAVTLWGGDVRDFAAPPGPFAWAIHGAATASAALTAADPLEMFGTIVAGTKHVLTVCRTLGVGRMLFISSGAVYGPQPPACSHLPEDYGGAPDPLDPGSAYGQGKRAAEWLCAVAQASGGPEIPIARPFAFLGPGLPLTRHFAAGNFLADALAGRPITVTGDGSPYRSYMYPTDLAVWLLTILAKGRSGRAYNVGSDQGVTIADLARHIGAAAGGLPVVIAGTPDPGKPASRYVPDIDRARLELGLTVRVGLNDAITRTLAALRGRNG